MRSRALSEVSHELSANPTRTLDEVFHEFSVRVRVGASIHLDKYMIKYILTQFDTSLRRKSAYVYFAGIFALCIIANIAVIAFRGIYGTNEGTYAYNIMEFVASLMLALVFLVITFVVLVATTAAFHAGDDRTLDSEAIRIFCGKLFLSLPLFFAGISFAVMCLFVFEDKKKAFAGFYVITLFIPRLIIFLAGDSCNISFFKMLRTYTISQCFTLIPYPLNPDRNVPLMIALGFGYAVLSIVIGIIIYNKKDLKEFRND